MVPVIDDVLLMVPVIEDLALAMPLCVNHSERSKGAMM